MARVKATCDFRDLVEDVPRLKREEWDVTDERAASLQVTEYGTLAEIITAASKEKPEVKTRRKPAATKE